MRGAGAQISKLQKNARYSELNAGPVTLPGYALGSCVLALTGQIPPIEQPFNVILPSQIIADKYGLMENNFLSIPIMLKCGNYKICEQYSVTSQERAHLQKAHQNVESEYRNVVDILETLRRKNLNKSPAVRPFGLT